MAVLGSLAYSWARDDRPARIEATLKAPELNVDRVQAITKAMLGDTAFDWPREGTWRCRSAVSWSAASR